MVLDAGNVQLSRSSSSPLRAKLYWVVQLRLRKGLLQRGGILLPFNMQRKRSHGDHDYSPVLFGVNEAGDGDDLGGKARGQLKTRGAAG